MKTNPPQPSILSIGATIVAFATAATAMQCNETSALLQVEFLLDQDMWDSLELYSTSVIIRPSGNVGNSTLDEYESYHQFSEFTDYGVCIPANGACFEVVVKGLPTDMYEISWDGNPVEVDHEYTSFDDYTVSTTELGDFCTSNCDIEALFEFEYWTGAVGSYDFRMLDQDGTNLFGCSKHDSTKNYQDYCYTSLYSMYKQRECLSRDTCYQFDIGGMYQWVNDSYTNAPTYVVHYDGNVVDEKDTWLFESIKFGDTCQTTCNPDTESSVEFFLYQYIDTYNCDPNEDVIQWDLTLNLEDGSTDGAAKGAIKACSNETDPGLIHDTICIPKESCATFYIERMNVSEAFITMRYMLKMDDVFYRIRRLDSYYEEGLNQTTLIGGCTSNSICQEANQVLFEAELQTVSNYDLNAISSYDIDWIFDYHDATRRDYFDPFFRSGNFFDSEYDLGSVYRTLECVPAEECVFDFNLTKDSPVKSYAVKRNGVGLSSYEAGDYGGYWGGSGSMLVTPFGSNCVRDQESSGLSAGAIAGIVIGCIVVVLVAISAYLWYKNEKEQQQPTASDGSTLTDDLLSHPLQEE